MKGKKIDTDFISEFISSCIKKNIISSEDIVKTASNEIKSIDKMIKEMEKMKVLRSKLVDVVSTFNKSQTSLKENDIKSLLFYKIIDKNIARSICESIQEKSLSVNDLTDNEFFCIKQLIENNILIKHDNSLIKGSLFENYIKFLSKEN